MKVFAVYLFALFLSLKSGADTPKRVVTLNPALTEIIFALGRGSNIVGTVEHSDYPEEAQKIARVGGYGRPNIEKLVSLKPDLILTFKEGVDLTTRSVQRAEIKMKVLNGRTLDDYPKLVTELGDLFQAKKEATQLVEKWNQEWSEIPRPFRSVSVMVQLEQTPLIVAAGSTFVSDIAEKCGGTNVFSNLKGYPSISIESLKDKKPEVILVLLEGLKESDKSNLVKFWAKKPFTKNSRVILFNPQVITRLGPRLPAEAKKLCHKILNEGS